MLEDVGRRRRRGRRTTDLEFPRTESVVEEDLVGDDPVWLLLVCCGVNDGEETLVPFPCSGRSEGDHGDGLAELLAPAMDALLVELEKGARKKERGREMVVALGKNGRRIGLRRGHRGEFIYGLGEAPAVPSSYRRRGQFRCAAVP